MTKLPASWADDKVFLDAYSSKFTDLPVFGNTSRFTYPQRRLNLSKSWMEFVNPIYLLPDNSTSSPLSVLMSQLGSQPKAFEIAWTLNLLLVNALAASKMEYDVRGNCEKKTNTFDCISC